MACVVMLALATVAAGHESDQFTLPAGREFADLGGYLNRWTFDAIKEGVDTTNARIERAKQRDASEAELKRLKSPAAVTVAVTRAFPSAFKVIEDLNWMAQSRAVNQRYPGAIPGYKEQFTNAYQNVHLPIDPRQVFRIWHSATIKAYGTYLGSDKIGHFTDMGRHYYHAYEKAKRRGATDAQAIEAAVAVGNEGFFFAEKGALGYLSAGAYSNADMVANYLGFQFYRNLTERVSLKGKMQPPMLERAGDYWRIAGHVAPDSDFFRVFISDHLNEALNPSHFEKGMRSAIRKAVRERRGMVLWRYRDAHGQRRPPGWFNDKALQYFTYYGQDYGHRGVFDELITIGRACFDRFAKEAKPNQRNITGHAPLHMAVLEGDMQKLRAQLKKGANVDASIVSDEPANTEQGGTPLHLAARDGHVEIARLLLAEGASINATNTVNQTPLHKAAGDRAMTRLLLEAGADVTARDAEGRTPLHWAASDDGENTLGLLVDRGADVAARDKHGQTPLHRAAAKGHAEPAVRLLRRGADAMAEAELGLTPLHLAAANNHPKVIYRLVQQGGSVTARDRSGWTPLHDAAHRGQLAAVEALLQAGAPLNAKDTYGTTPLHLACRAKQRATALTLIERGAKAGHANARGVTPLHEAAFAGDQPLARALIEAGAKPRAADAQGRTAQSIARTQNHRTIARLLTLQKSAVEGGGNSR
jgi:ankyrin repeat protein